MPRISTLALGCQFIMATFRPSLSLNIVDDGAPDSVTTRYTARPEGPAMVQFKMVVLQLVNLYSTLSRCIVPAFAIVVVGRAPKMDGAMPERAPQPPAAKGFMGESGGEGEGFLWRCLLLLESTGSSMDSGSAGGRSNILLHVRDPKREGRALSWRSVALIAVAAQTHRLDAGLATPRDCGYKHGSDYQSLGVY